MLDKNISLNLVQSQQIKDPKLYDLLNKLINAVADLDRQFALSTFATVIKANVGITFPNAQTPSTDPNTLDDYEEGVWVPTDASGAALAFAFGGPVLYIKVGKLVYVTADITYPATASGAGAAIGGLPFTPINTQQDFAIGFSTFANSLYGIIPASTGSILLYNSLTSAPVTNVQLSTKVVRLSTCYIAVQ